MSETKQGRPVEYPLPEPIPASAEEIARAILSASPKKREEWQHVKEREAGS